MACFNVVESLDVSHPVRRASVRTDVAARGAVPLAQCSPTVVWANHFGFAPGQDEGPWAAASRLLLYVRSGSGVVSCHGRQIKLTRGDYCFLGWGEPVRYRARWAEPLCLLTCHLHVNACYSDPAPPFLQKRSNRRQYGGDPADVPVPELERVPRHGDLIRTPQVPLIMERIIEVVRQPTPMARALLNAYAHALLAELAATACEAHASLSHPRVADILRVRQYLDINYKEPLTREWMAEMAGMSVAHFTRAFRTVVGTTPHRFLLNRRLSEVQMRLRLSSDGLKQIARDTGFCDEFHLSHAFKKAYGVAPQTYRRQVNGGER